MGAPGYPPAPAHNAAGPVPAATIAMPRRQAVQVVDAVAVATGAGEARSSHLWLGHEQISTTGIYLHADMSQKERAIDRTKPVGIKPGRYRPPDATLAFLESL